MVVFNKQIMLRMKKKYNARSDKNTNYRIANKIFTNKKNTLKLKISNAKHIFKKRKSYKKKRLTVDIKDNLSALFKLEANIESHYLLHIRVLEKKQNNQLAKYQYIQKNQMLMMIHKKKGKS